MTYFCTYCDQGYAARMLCLHASLRAQGEPFRLFVLCFDGATAAVVGAESAASLVAIPLEEFMAADPAYAATRPTRSRVEFYFTATAALVRHCLGRVPEADIVTYLDADLFFFAPPSAVLAEQGGASVGIVPHRFTKYSHRSARNGTYNVGWVSFRRDADGLACLDWWRASCLEWCYDRVENGRFADQGYLDEFSRRFRGVRVLEHPGINAAPWNVEPEHLTAVGGKPSLRGAPVLFYHYQGIREVEPGWFDPGLRNYRVPLTPAVAELIYLPYLRQLTAMQARLRRHGILPVIGYPRLPMGWDAKSVWERFRTKRMWTLYRRLRGKLLYCPEPAA
jgi:hypothetical protein